LPACQPCEAGLGWERFRNSALAEYQNRKIFFSLIEKIFARGRLKKCLENFSVLLAAVAKRRRAETLGGIVPMDIGTIKSRSPDFRQKKFGFYPKGTANYHFLESG